ncbi:MAG: hypothetical protein PHI63_05890 [Patescibacteria group bacterium]|nr:hypothetical protein [Patescibacteria group bacterium]
MKKYFIPAELAYHLAEEATAEGLFERKGYIGLYSHNMMRTDYFKNPVICPTRYGWIAERGNMPSYLKNVVFEEPKTI